MRIVRFAVPGKVKYGMLAENMVHGFHGSPFAHLKRLGNSSTLDGNTYKLGEVRLLAPCLPSKIVGLGLNYRSHAEETQMPIPSVPLIFLKPSTSVIGPDAKIALPRFSRRVDYEGELGIVIAKKAKNVPEDRAKEVLREQRVVVARYS